MADNTEESTKSFFQTIPVETRLQIYGDTCKDTRTDDSDEKQHSDHDRDHNNEYEFDIGFGSDYEDDSDYSDYEDDCYHSYDSDHGFDTASGSDIVDRRECRYVTDQVYITYDKAQCSSLATLSQTCKQFYLEIADLLFKDRIFTISVSDGSNPSLRPSLASFDFLDRVRNVRIELAATCSWYSPNDPVLTSLEKLITRLRASQQLRDFRFDYSMEVYRWCRVTKDTTEQARNMAIESGTKAGRNRVQCELDFASRTLELLGGRAMDEWVQNEHIVDDEEAWTPDLDDTGTKGSWGHLYW